MRYRHEHAYAMPPHQHWAQADAIKPGMTLAEVRRHIRGVTRELESPGKIMFVMEPRIRTAFAIPLTINMYINIELDTNGRVTRVSTSDG